MQTAVLETAECEMVQEWAGGLASNVFQIFVSHLYLQSNICNESGKGGCSEVSPADVIL